MQIMDSAIESERQLLRLKSVAWDKDASYLVANEAHSKLRREHDRFW